MAAFHRETKENDHEKDDQDCPQETRQVQGRHEEHGHAEACRGRQTQEAQRPERCGQGPGGRQGADGLQGADRGDGEEGPVDQPRW